MDPPGPIWSNAIGAAGLLTYYLLFCALLPTLLKACRGVPAEVVRKLQHVAYSLSIFLLLGLFDTWWVAIAAAFLLVLIGYPGLLIFERTSAYRRLLVDRTANGGELRRQLLYVQLSFATLIGVFWGLLGPDWRPLIAVAVMAWGFGDAAAALVGKFLGRKRLVHRLIESAKTYEGTAAMILFAGLALFGTLVSYGGQSWLVSLVVALVVAPVCGIVELFSRRGSDTLTVPLSAALSMAPLIALLTWMGF
jgi:dolichol kinase